MKIGQVGNTDSGIRKSIQNTKYLPKSILLTWNRRPQVVLLFLEWTFMYLYRDRHGQLHCPFFLCNNQENHYFFAYFFLSFLCVSTLKRSTTFVKAASRLCLRVVKRPPLCCRLWQQHSDDDTLISWGQQTPNCQFGRIRGKKKPESTFLCKN